MHHGDLCRADFKQYVLVSSKLFFLTRVLPRMFELTKHH